MQSPRPLTDATETPPDKGEASTTARLTEFYDSKEMSMPKVKRTQDQAVLIRKVRKARGITTRALAAELDKSLKTLRAWLLPKGNKARRNMPQASRDHLARMLERPK